MSVVPLCAGFCCLKGCVGRLKRSSILWKGFTEEQPCPSPRDSPQASLLPLPSVEAGASITHSLQPWDSLASSPGWRLVGMDPGPGGGLSLVCSHRAEPFSGVPSPEGAEPFTLSGDSVSPGSPSPTELGAKGCFATRNQGMRQCPAWVTQQNV